jgi:DNA polymerase
MLVGEQPGDSEDLTGRPFVGPAGRLLDQALEQAGIDRAGVYVTNVVKHFKWEPRGKRRIHKKPNAGEVEACRPWLDAELVRRKRWYASAQRRRRRFWDASSR